MKSLEQIKELYKSKCIDGRDLCRLAQFIPFNELKDFGLEANEDVTEEEWNSKVKPLTEYNVLKQLEDDVDFGFKKALNRRGISSSLMYECVRMWNWVLENDLEDFTEYAQYGLPLFKATAVKYGFNNPIGDMHGDEYIFSTDSEEWFDY